MVYYDLMLCTAPSWFNTTLRNLCTCLLTFFGNNIMTGEHTHATSKEIAPCSPAISIVIWKVKYPLHFVFSSCILNHYIKVQINNCLKKHLHNQSSHYRWFPLQKEVITCYHQIDTCCQQTQRGYKGGPM